MRFTFSDEGLRNEPNTLNECEILSSKHLWVLYRSAYANNLVVSQTLVWKLSDFKILLPLFATLVFTDEAPYVDDVDVTVPYFVWCENRPKWKQCVYSLYHPVLLFAPL